MHYHLSTSDEEFRHVAPVAQRYHVTSDTLGREFDPDKRDFLTEKLKNEIKMPNGWRTIKSLVHKIRLHGRRGKGMAESFSREKVRQKHRRKKVDGKSCVTFFLCDPGWYVH